MRSVLGARELSQRSSIRHPAPPSRRWEWALQSIRHVTARLHLDRAQIIAVRRRVGALDERLPWSPGALRQAAWAGLQDSMPRAALLSIHARVDETGPDAWEDPALVQVWGPRFSAYVVAAEDRAVFTLGRLPDDAAGLRRAQEAADRLDSYLAGRRMPFGEAGRGMGVAPNSLRYGTTTGRLLIRWDGAHQPMVWTVSASDGEPADARLELARRYLHVFGVGNPTGFSTWAGVKLPRAQAVFAALAPSLVPVLSPVGEAWILAEDEPAFAEPPSPPAPARLLPSGDTYTLLQGAERAVLVPDAAREGELWTSRVWPGAVLVGGEVVGVWRRADSRVAIDLWRRLTPAERAAVEAEATSLPLPGLAGRITVAWTG